MWKLVWLVDWTCTVLTSCWVFCFAVRSAMRAWGTLPLPRPISSVLYVSLSVCHIHRAPLHIHHRLIRSFSPFVFQVFMFLWPLLVTMAASNHTIVKAGSEIMDGALLATCLPPPSDDLLGLEEGMDKNKHVTPQTRSVLGCCFFFFSCPFEVDVAIAEALYSTTIL